MIVNFFNQNQSKHSTGWIRICDLHLRWAMLAKKQNTLTNLNELTFPPYVTAITTQNSSTHSIDTPPNFAHTSTFISYQDSFPSIDGYIIFNKCYEIQISDNNIQLQYLVYKKNIIYFNYSEDFVCI